MVVSAVNSHTNASRIGWHLWEIDLMFAPGLPPGWHPLEKGDVCHANSLPPTAHPLTLTADMKHAHPPDMQHAHPPGMEHAHAPLARIHAHQQHFAPVAQCGDLSPKRARFGPLQGYLAHKKKQPP